ncbi:hypothetical protein H0N98_01870, partial [Candidatus Micrarchaeota archaeon]|nr:hypothetical protein [Candidatus Micrarchaeota archaeon]
MFRINEKKEEDDMRKNWICLLVIIVLCSVAFSAEPSLQVSKYSILPSDVYPGTSGYIQVTLENTGDATAMSPTAYYDFNGVRNSLFTSEISSGSSTQISIPFRIPQDAGGSIKLINIDVYYSYNVGSSSPSRLTSLSVPIEVSQQKVLEVRTVSLD